MSIRTFPNECIAETLSGPVTTWRCPNPALPGSDFCWEHDSEEQAYWSDILDDVNQEPPTEADLARAANLRATPVRRAIEAALFDHSPVLFHQRHDDGQVEDLAVEILVKLGGQGFVVVPASQVVRQEQTPKPQRRPDETVCVSCERAVKPGSGGDGGWVHVVTPQYPHEIRDVLRGE